MAVFARLVLLGYRGVNPAGYSDYNVYKRVRDASDELVTRILAEVQRQTRRIPELKQGDPDTRHWKIGDPDLLHELRRCALHLEQDGRLPDSPPGIMDPTGDILLRDAYRSPALPKCAHFIRHGESSGLYVPLFFPEPFWMEEPGISVGSAQALLMETENLAATLAGEMPSSPWSDSADSLEALRAAAQAAVKTGLSVELFWEEITTSAGEV